MCGHSARRGLHPRSKKFPEQPAQPSGGADERAGADRRSRALSYPVSISVKGQPDTRGEGRAVDVIRETTDADRATAPDRQIENLLGDLRHAVENRAAAGQHDARVEAFFVAGPANFVPDQMKN